MTQPADGDKWHPNNRQGLLGTGFSRRMWPLHGGLAVVCLAGSLAGPQLILLVPAVALAAVAVYERRMPERRDRVRR